MLKILYTDSDRSGNNKNFSYLLGFQPSFGIIAYSKKEISIFLDGRYIDKKDNVDKEKLKEKLGEKDLEINFIILTKKYIKDLKLLSKKHKKIGLEKNIPYFFYEEINNHIKNKEFIFEDNFFGNQRLIKAPEGIKYIKKAINIIDKVFLEVVKLNKTGKLIGKKESELRAFIIQKIFDFGGDGESFETIVAFGKNSAIPHHTSGNTTIKNGPLLIDMGALYKGYASDFTRTFWVGNHTGQEKMYEKFKEIHDIVKLAHKQALERSKPGVKIKDIDKEARNIIGLAGYLENFNHSTGHGIGLDVHESPAVNKDFPGEIKPGFVFTIEPGIYLKGKFGVRLENIVVCDKKGCKEISKINLSD